MTTIPIYQVDSFTDAVFGGNLAAVGFLDAWLDDHVMRGIAAENNPAETAFVTPSSDEASHYALRWFIPTQEVGLCGYATPGGDLDPVVHAGAPSRSMVMFGTLGGNLAVHRADGDYEMDLPSHPPKIEPMPGGLAQAIGARPEEFLQASNENGMYLAIAESADHVCSFDPDMDFIKSLPGDGLIISAPGNGMGNCDFVSRYFAPNTGIPEAPVTGPAYSVLVPYWAERLGELTLSARQVSHRGGSLSCHLVEDRVILGGNAILYLE